MGISVHKTNEVTSAYPHLVSRKDGNYEMIPMPVAQPPHSVLRPSRERMGSPG